MKEVVVVGAGGFGREVLELLRDINAVGRQWEVLGFLDDDRDIHGTTINGAEVLGGLDWLEGPSPSPHAVLGVGSPAVKKKLVPQLRDRVAGFPSLVHPTAVVSRYVEVDEGVVITAGNIVTANVVLGAFAMVNLMCTIGHDAVIGEYATLSPGVNVSGYVRVGQGCDLGTGAKLVPGCEIGAWSIIGAGAVVAADVPANSTAVGVPARVIKERKPGWELG